MCKARKITAKYESRNRKDMLADWSEHTYRLPQSSLGRSEGGRRWKSMCLNLTSALSDGVILFWWKKIAGTLFSYNNEEMLV